MLELAAIVIGYLFGSIPAPYWIARVRKGIDIRTVGVRNMGAANVMREVGILEGALAAVIDVGKGAAAVWVAQLLGVGEYWTWAAGLAAIVGHNFPLFLGFRGGRGVASFVGVMVYIFPIGTAISLGIFATLWFFIRHTFTTLLITAPVLFYLAWLLEDSIPLLVYVVITVLFMAIRSKYRMGEVGMALKRVAGKNQNAGNDNGTTSGPHGTQKNIEG